MNNTIKLGTAAKNEVRELRNRKNNPELYMPISTGLVDLDNIINGGMPRDPFYTAIIGEKKKGKTTFGLQFFLTYCEATCLKAVLYNLEENTSQAARRALAMRSATVGRTNFFKLDYTDEDLDYLEVIADDIDAYDTYVNDRLYGLVEIFEDAKEQKAKVVCIDNFQLLTDGQGRDQREKLEWLSKFVMRKRNEGYYIFLVSQGTNDGKSFGSSQVEKDADLCILMQDVFESDDKKKKNPIKGLRKLLVQTSRFSDTGELEVLFDAAHSRVRTVEVKREDPKDESFAYFEEVQMTMKEWNDGIQEEQGEDDE